MSAIVLVASLLLKKNNSIFMLKRENTGWYDGVYALPGGRVEHHETAKQACIREAYEELGIVLNADALPCHVIADLLLVDGRKCIAFLFVTDTYTNEPFNKEPHLHSDARWFDIDQLPEDTLCYNIECIKAYKQNSMYLDYGHPK